ncbi:hypothetical protein PanWU01x14_163140, partial [Parasponia andersonii]
WVHDRLTETASWRGRRLARGSGVVGRGEPLRVVRGHSRARHVWVFPMRSSSGESRRWVFSGETQCVGQW